MRNWTNHYRITLGPSNSLRSNKKGKLTQYDTKDT
jgi:hypothetical protein